MIDIGERSEFAGGRLAECAELEAMGSPGSAPASPPALAKSVNGPPQLKSARKTTSFEEGPGPGANPDWDWDTRANGRSAAGSILDPSRAARDSASGRSVSERQLEQQKQQQKQQQQQQQEQEQERDKNRERDREHSEQHAQEHQRGTQEIRPSRKRYFILAMFVVLHVVKSFQWICLASITNVVAKYYQVDNLAINWTTILFMVTFLVLALPVSWIMDSIGLRRSVLIGTLGVTLGVTIKCFTCHRAGFPLSMLGHLIVGLTEPFFFSSYAQVASVWFPDHQVALATAASIIGEQTGLALGFIVPPLVIGRDPDDFETIQRGLLGLFLVVALISIANTVSILLFFDEEPKFAPGIARFKQKRDETIRRQSQQLAWTARQVELADTKTTRHAHRRAWPPGAAWERARRPSARRASTISRLSQSLGEQVKLSAKFMTNRHFILLLVGFGINMGICYSMHTLLNQMIVPAHQHQAELPAAAAARNSTGALDGPTHAAAPAPDAAAAAAAAATTTTTTSGANWTGGGESNLVVGKAGLIMILSGLLGSGLCGYALDKYHRYKLTTVAVYLLTLVAMAALASCLLLESAAILYLAIIPLGFAQTGYASCAFDYGVELTYPKPELLSSTLLNMSAQVFGVPLSLAGSLIVDTYGSQALGAFFCAALALGLVATCLQGGELRRQTAVNERLGQGAKGVEAGGVPSGPGSQANAGRNGCSRASLAAREQQMVQA